MEETLQGRYESDRRLACGSHRMRKAFLRLRKQISQLQQHLSRAGIHYLSCVQGSDKRIHWKAFSRLQQHKAEQGRNRVQSDSSNNDGGVSQDAPQT